MSGMAARRQAPWVEIGAIVIGLALVAVGLLRPELLWDLGRVRAGRAVAGDAAVSGLFIGVGVLLAAAGLFLLVRRRGGATRG
jgi:formate-dependent nitrite reductase membrane component NrfD